MYPTYPELQADAAVLAELLGTKYWEVLARYYEVMLGSKRDKVIMADRNTFEYAKGVYLGSRDVVEMPQAIIDEYQRQRTAREEADRARSFSKAASFHGRGAGA